MVEFAGSDGVVLTGGALCYIMRKVSKTGDEDLKLGTRFEKINREINPETKFCLRQNFLQNARMLST